MNVSAGQMMSEPIQDSANDLVQGRGADIRAVMSVSPVSLDSINVTVFSEFF